MRSVGARPAILMLATGNVRVRPTFRDARCPRAQACAKGSSLEPMLNTSASMWRFVAHVARRRVGKVERVLDFALEGPEAMLHFFTAPLPIEALPRTPVSMPSPPPLGRVTRVLLGGAILLSGRRVRGLRSHVGFLHLPLTQRGLQSLLTSALPGVKVTTVGRVADFERSLSQGQDVVLTLPVVLAANGLSPALRGHRGGRGDEAYAVVGLNSAPDPQRIKVDRRARSPRSRRHELVRRGPPRQAPQGRACDQGRRPSRALANATRGRGPAPERRSGTSGR